MLCPMLRTLCRWIGGIISYKAKKAKRYVLIYGGGGGGVGPVWGGSCQ
jgi:hypothetical protein